MEEGRFCSEGRDGGSFSKVGGSFVREGGSFGREGVRCWCRAHGILQQQSSNPLSVKAEHLERVLSAIHVSMWHATRVHH